MLHLKYLFLTLAIINAFYGVFGSNEILSILDEADDLSSSEVNAAMPLFKDLQNQYEFIVSEVNIHGLDTDQQEDVELIRQEIAQQLEAIMNSLKAEEENIDQPFMEYDGKLPTLKDLLKGSIKKYYQGMTQEQIFELEDAQSIISDAISEAQSNVNELVKRSHNIESELLKLNKPKILKYIYKALSIMFHASARLRRAAYCVYSSTPQLNESLHNIYDGVDCYTYTAALIVRVQIETVETVRIIKNNILDLANVYKKIAAKNSLMGKIITSVLSILRITNDIRETYTAAMKALDGVENQLPDAAAKSIDCGETFAGNIPFIVETVTNVTTCLAYVEEPTTDYDFLLPESQRQTGDFNDIE